VTVVITPPTKLSDDLRQLYEKIRDLRPDNPRQALTNTRL
jgi:hypothetical protein